jgi:phage antirepressor YoqD-like protein
MQSLKPTYAKKKAAPQMELRVFESLRGKVDRLTTEIATLSEANQKNIQTIDYLTKDNKALEAANAQMEPLVASYQRFLSSDGMFNKESAAKLLGFPSAIMFNRWLHYIGIQYPRYVLRNGGHKISHWMLRANWVKRNDLFQSRTSEDIYRGKQVTIRITSTGLEFLKERLDIPYIREVAMKGF